MDGTRTTLYWVGIYDVDRRFGGQEEGGWWFNVGELQTDPEVYGDTLPRSFTDEAEAIAYREKMRDKVQALNLAERRVSINSVVSIGEYFAEIHEGALPAFYPEQRPHYE